MLGLFIKDFFIVKKYLLIMLVIVPLFMLSFFKSYEEYTASMIICACSYCLLMYILSYEDKNKSERVILSLPVTKNIVVWQRYISVFTFLGISVLLYILALFLLSLVGKLGIGFFDFFNIKLLFISVIPAFLLYVIYLPVFFKWGYFKTRYIVMLFYFSVFFGVSLVKKLFSLEFVQNIINSEFSLRIINKVSDMPQAGQIVIGITIIAIIYFVSMIVSIKVYRKRNF